MNTGEYLTLPEVSALIHTPPGTLYQWRTKKIGPPSIKVGRRVIYRRTDLEKWLEQLSSVA
jgi:predicted DNA-binding transcriptional regulator AlpA